ncbi:MAG: DNA repair protein RadC [Ginsengibacter sp.]
MESTNKSSTSIKSWAPDDRPREKLLAKGKESLSDSELLAILINSGSGKDSAVDVAKKVLRLGEDNLDELGKLTIKDMMSIKGIGEARAITLVAALELGRRRHSSAALDKKKVRSSAEIAAFLRTSLKDHSYEVFAVVFLNRASKVNHFEIMSKGGLTNTIVDPRLIFLKALEVQATSIVLCHNHPSGNLTPSRADEELTTRLKNAGMLLDIKVLDHLIVSNEGYYSFADNGLI